MKITLNWLRNYVDFDGSPTELVERLTMLGLEVESVNDFGKMNIFKPGVYKWKDETGFIGPVNQIHEIHVVDCGWERTPYLRAYWNGGYYNVNEELGNFPFHKPEWPNTWVE